MMFEKIIAALIALFKGPMTHGEVAAKLDDLAHDTTERLEWRTSIVDLMKVLGLPSDLPARAKLARELGYTGILDGSASMNQWLHAAVLKKVAERGIKI